MRRCGYGWLLLIAMLALVTPASASHDRDRYRGSSFEEWAMDRQASRGVGDDSSYSRRGYGQSTEDVTRAEAADILRRASGHSAYAADVLAYGYGSPSIVRPRDPVNVAEFLKMLTQAFGLPTDLSYRFVDVPSRSWYAPYAGVASRYDLFPYRTRTLAASTPLTRAELAIALEQYLSGGTAYDDYRRFADDDRYLDRNRYNDRSCFYDRNDRYRCDRNRSDDDRVCRYDRYGDDRVCEGDRSRRDASCYYDSYDGRYRCDDRRDCFTDAYGRYRCNDDGRFLGTCPSSYACTQYESGNRCVSRVLDCGPGYELSCFRSCGTSSCRGECCRCVAR